MKLVSLIEWLRSRMKRDGGDIVAQVYEDDALQFRWRMVRAGRIVADSGESYTRRADAIRSVAALVEGLQERGAEVRQL